MAITSITVFHAELPLRWSVGHAAARRRSSENIFCLLELADGTLGVGEGLPRPYVTGETMEDAWRAAKTFDAEPLVAAWPSLQAVEPVLKGLLTGEPKAPSLRSALELALVDALGRASGRSAASLVAERLGLPDPAERAIAYSAVIPFARRGLLRLLSWGVRAYGFSSAKLKVGGPVEAEARRLEAVRRWLGPSVELRADANGAWSPKEALAALEASRRSGLACLEQPVAPEAWSELAAHLPGPPPVALMADEGLSTEEDLGRLQATGALQAVNSRVAKMGGLIPAARISRRAVQAGLSVLVGCHVGESTVLSAAGRQLAALVPEARWLEGSYDRWLLAASVAGPPLGFGRGGRARIELKAGLGVEVDRAGLERLALRRLTLWPPEGGGA